MNTMVADNDSISAAMMMAFGVSKLLIASPPFCDNAERQSLG